MRNGIFIVRIIKLALIQRIDIAEIADLCLVQFFCQTVLHDLFNDIIIAHNNVVVFSVCLLNFFQHGFICVEVGADDLDSCLFLKAIQHFLGEQSLPGVEYQFFVVIFLFFTTSGKHGGCHCKTKCKGC